MKGIEDKFKSDPANYDPAFKKREINKNPDNDDELNQKTEKFSNKRLMTPRMRKMTQKSDARDLLQDEVNESILRLKKAKFGHRLDEIVPDHPNKFYLPDKANYFPKDRTMS